MSIGNRMRGLGESVYYLDDLKPKMDELMGDVSYELNHEVGKRKLLVRLDGFGEEYKPQIETLMDEELPVGYRMEYDSFPLDFIRLDFLESTRNGNYGQQYIDTGLTFKTDLNVKVDMQPLDLPSSDGWFMFGSDSQQYSLNQLIYGRIMAPESRGYTFLYNSGNGVSAVELFGKTNLQRFQLTFDGKTRELHYNGKTYTMSTEAPIVELPARFGVFTCMRKAPWNKTEDKIDKLGVFVGRVFAINVSDDEKAFNFIPSLDTTGTPCMFDLVTKQPFYNSGTGQFIAGLTMKQALNLAKLPAPSDNNSLTISLPKEATLVQHNQEVNAALEAAAEKGWNIPVQYREAGEEKEIINKYAECKTQADVLAINPEYKKDLTDEGEWIYPLPEMTVFPSPNMSNGFFTGSKLKKIKGVFPKCTDSCALAGQVSTVEEVDVEFPIATYVTNTCLWRTNLKKLRIVAPKARYFYGNAHTDAAKFVDCEFYAPVTENIQELCSSARYLEEVKGEFGANVKVAGRAFYNCEKLRVLPTSYPMMQVAPDMFYGCQLSAETAIAILDSFPKWTSGEHLVTVGIHVDYENDEGVIAAIENAEAKGWTVTTQWNGTATAQVSSTYGLRRKPIYAKLGTMELRDGTVEQYLAWGHYVTNWKENGYQEFASVEEAEEHFNIKKEITE